MDAPIVVIIPAYRAADTIGRAIASALAEPEVGAVVVVDDASTDDTYAAARAADDGSGRLSVLRLEHNQGPAVARNFAISQSDLPLIALLDADDVFLPGRFATMLASAGEEWDFVADNILFVTGNPLPEREIADAVSGPVRARPLGLTEFVAGNISHPFRQRSELGFIKPLFRRAAIERLQLAYDPALWLGEDYVLYCQALLRGARITLLSACGYVAVQRERSLSGRHRTSHLEALAKADAALIEEARSRGLGRSERALLQRHLASLTTKVDIRQALDLSHERGRYRALAMLAMRPSRLARIALGILGDRLGNAISAKGNVRKLLPDDGFR